MARIRSVHPGLFTDEAFVELSDAAQILLIGIWTECDDQGVFEWKPTTLRMRLRPVKDGPIEVLLAELVQANCVLQYEVDGRQYGAVRNFRKYQRPKSPNATHPTTKEIRKYVALPKTITEIKEVKKAPLPPNEETRAQMEDVGGRMEGKEVTPSEPEVGSSGGERGARPPESAIPEILDRRPLKPFPHLWELPEKWREYAVDKHPLLDPDGQAVAFRDYHIDKATLSGDWEVAWHRWLRIGEDMGQQVDQPAGASDPAATPQQVIALDERRRMLRDHGIAIEAFERAEGVSLRDATRLQVDEFCRQTAAANYRSRQMAG